MQTRESPHCLLQRRVVKTYNIHKNRQPLPPLHMDPRASFGFRPESEPEDPTVQSSEPRPRVLDLRHILPAAADDGGATRGPGTLSSSADERENGEQTTHSPATSVMPRDDTLAPTSVTPPLPSHGVP